MARLRASITSSNAPVLTDSASAGRRPLSVLRVAEIAQSVLPDDVVHVVAVPGSIGACLAGHELVGKISFTGAPTAGKTVIKRLRTT